MATLEYEKENLKQIKFKLNRKYDEDIIERLDAMQNVQGYLKARIRADIAASTPKNHSEAKQPEEDSK